MAEYQEESLQAAQTFSIDNPSNVFLPVKGEQYEILDRGLIVSIATVLAVARPAAGLGWSDCSDVYCVWWLLSRYWQSSWRAGLKLRTRF